ncbi:MAG: ABC transporter substrate-binding protein, partial [Synergistaceae bacterium]|nr:ABC transporter substrate-binding protein [Synergistaceae bacterium]
MKKIFALSLLACLIFACAAFAKPDDVIKIKLAAQATSGQVFQYLAEERGYLKDEGIDVEMVYINNGTDAFSALSSGQVDVISTYGTGGPLIQIVNGQPFTIFGGYMIIGETPVYGLPETEYKGLESFKGKKIAIMRGGTPDIVLKGILYDAGLLDTVTFV